MWTSKHRLRAACMVVLPGLGSVLWTHPAVAQLADSASVRMPLASTFGRDDWLALLVIVLCGVIGAFASDLLTDGGRLEPIRSDEQGLLLGFLGKLLIGAVAAVVSLALNPSDEWWRLIGAALAAGVGGEAILLARVSARKAESAEKDRAQAEEKARNVAGMASSQLRLLRDAALGLTPEPKEGVLAESAPGSVTAGKSSFRETLSASGDERARTVAVLAEQFSAEIAAFTGGTIRDRVRTILVRNLGPNGVDTRTLAEMAADDNVRRIIARDIRREFTDLHLKPEWGVNAVKPDSTLDSLTDEIDQRRTV